MVQKSNLFLVQSLHTFSLGPRCDMNSHSGLYAAAVVSLLYPDIIVPHTGYEYTVEKDYQLIFFFFSQRAPLLLIYMGSMVICVRVRQKGSVLEQSQSGITGLASISTWNKICYLDLFIQHSTHNSLALNVDLLHMRRSA